MQDKTVLLEPNRYRNSDYTIIELSTLTERSLLTKLSIYSTAIMIPVAFLILLGYALFILNRKNEDSLSTVLINALIIILTVMAVRQILVPSDIQGELTRLDLLLIVEGLVLLLLAFFKVTSVIWAYSRTATPL